MRLIKFLLLAAFGVFAAIAGVFVVAALALGGALFFLVRTFTRRTLAGAPVRRPVSRGRDPARQEAIDVIATEVPPESLGR